MAPLCRPDRQRRHRRVRRPREADAHARRRGSRRAARLRRSLGRTAPDHGRGRHDGRRPSDRPGRRRPARTDRLGQRRRVASVLLALLTEDNARPDRRADHDR
ncbi:hypothetical protein AMK31_27430 [Streptomyces sp. TSRI0107]|nr:hypothetical protein AMK31_27430 [Streptomyces sp. TSRI0107]